MPAGWALPWVGVAGLLAVMSTADADRLAAAVAAVRLAAVAGLVAVMSTARRLDNADADRLAAVVAAVPAAVAGLVAVTSAARRLDVLTLTGWLLLWLLWQGLWP